MADVKLERFMLLSNNSYIQKQDSLTRQHIMQNSRFGESPQSTQKIEFQNNSETLIGQFEKKMQGKSYTPKEQHTYDSFSQQLIAFDSEYGMLKPKNQQISNPMQNRRQTRRHQSYIKNKIGQSSEDGMPFTQMHQQSIMRKTYNKIRIQVQVKIFVQKMMQLLERQKKRIFAGNPLFFNIIQDKAAVYKKDIFQPNYVNTNETSEGQLDKMQSPQYTTTHKRSNTLLKSTLRLNKAINHYAKKIQEGCTKCMHKLPIFSHFSQFRFIWDQIQLLCLGFFFFIIPLLISFNLEIQEIEQNLAVHKILISFLFLDILINFNTSLFQQGKEIKSRVSIAKNYLKNYVVTLIGLLIFLTLNNSQSSSGFRRFVNICLIIFFARLKQFERVLKKIEIQYHFSPRISQILRLTNLFLTNIYIIHMLACIWIIIAKVQSDPEESWLHLNNTINEPWYIQYLNAFYFNTVTMVTVGYGDISPQTHFERLFSILTVLSACGVFAYSISEVGNIFLEMNTSLKQRKNNLFIINNYMKKKKITSDLQYQIRHYLEYYWNESFFEDSQKEQDIINQLSNNLKENLMIEANRILVIESPFFRDNFSFKTLLKTVSIVQEQRCTPEEIVYLEGDLEESAIYFIEKGSVQIFHTLTSANQVENKEIMQSNTIKAGQYFGELSFFTGRERLYNVRSLEFTTLIKIDREKFLEIIKECPEDYEKFCFIRDDIVQNNNIEKSLKRCPYCKNEQTLNSFHRYSECPMIFFIPNKRKLQDQFKYSYEHLDRRTYKRQSCKQYNSLGRIEQVKGDQSRLVFQEESIITAYMHANNILQSYISDEEEEEDDDDDDDDEYDQEQDENEKIKTNQTINNSTHSNESDAEQEVVEHKQKQYNPKTSINCNQSYSDNNSESEEGNSSSVTPSPDRERSRSVSFNKKIQQHSRISKEIQKSIVIEEDQQESESQAIHVKNQSLQSVANLQTNEQTEDFDGKFDMDEQKFIDSTNYLNAQLINTVKPFSTNILKKTKSTLAETNPMNSLQQLDVDNTSHSNIISTSEIKLNISHNKKPEDSRSSNQLDTTDKRPFNIDSSQDKSIQLVAINKEIQSLSDLKQQLISPILTKQREKSRTSMVKFKLPSSALKKHQQNNKSLQDLDFEGNNRPKGLSWSEKKKRSQTSLTHLPDFTQINTNFNRILNKINTPNKTHQEKSLPEIKKAIPMLRRLCSQGSELLSKENLVTSSLQGKSLEIKLQQQNTNEYQQRFSSQLDTLVNNFQKIQDMLTTQSHQNQNYQQEQNRYILNQDKEINITNHFDKMKLFEIYFPQNNHDVVLSHFNQLQIIKNKMKKQFKYSLLFTPTKPNLIKNISIPQSPQPTQQQQQVMQDLFNQNTLNRLKYMRNENHKKNSMSEQMYLSQIQRNKTPQDNGDPSDDPMNNSLLKSQASRVYYLEEPNQQNQDSSSYIIPNYFGLQKKSESQASIAAASKKSRFGKRTSIFKTYEQDQSSQDNSSNDQNDKNNQE